jgi:hypothetical protein
MTFKSCVNGREQQLGSGAAFRISLQTDQQAVTTQGESRLARGKEASSGVSRKLRAFSIAIRTDRKRLTGACTDLRYARKRVPECAEGGHQLDGAIDALPITASSGSLPVELGMEPAVRILPGASGRISTPERRRARTRRGAAAPQLRPRASRHPGAGSRSRRTTP